MFSLISWHRCLATPDIYFSSFSSLDFFFLSHFFYLTSCILQTSGIFPYDLEYRSYEWVTKERRSYVPDQPIRILIQGRPFSVPRSAWQVFQGARCIQTHTHSLACVPILCVCWNIVPKYRRWNNHHAITSPADHHSNCFLLSFIILW